MTGLPTPRSGVHKMNRPLFQVPEIISAHGDSFVERHGSTQRTSGIAVARAVMKALRSTPDSRRFPRSGLSLAFTTAIVNLLCHISWP
ncbi:MAG: hypothetical protein QOJ99_5 [Bryobacterales bacterium]|nr:hypothetical protein [Bryobacterales bacterium]